MSPIICIIGNKGGTGKTTLSHLLCQGFGLLGQRSACVLTDTSREPLAPEGRRYAIADARTPESLNRVVGKLRAMEHWVGVVDGGGNRADVDRMLDGLADIVLLPFRDSHEDLRTVLRDLETFPRAYALPSQWPTNAWQRDAADRNVAQILGAHKHRILNPVISLSASKLLLQKNVPDGLPTNLGNACRALARQVIEVLELGDADGTPSTGPETSEEAGATPSTMVPDDYASTARH